jgi:arabinogalactan oligomer / maltooligosaccharide transport system substrate-binding protein
MFGKRGALVAIVVAFALVLAACGGTAATTTTAPSTESTTTTAAMETTTTAAMETTTTAAMADLTGTITLWHSWKDTEIESLNEVIAGFQTLHPNVKFNVLFVPFDDLQNKVTTEWSTGTGPSVLIDATDRASQYLASDLIYDMKGLISQSVIDTINPAALSAVNYDGVYAGLPQSLKGVVMFRNKTLVPDAPKTFDDIVATGNASLERGFFFSMADLVTACGGQVADADGMPAFNTDAGVCWLELLNQFPNPTYNSDDDVDTFKAGQTGIIIDGTWNIGTLSDAIGADNLAIDAWPTAANGSMSGVVQTESIYISNNTTGDDLDAAKAFVEYFLSPEAQKILSDSSKAAHIPAIGGVDVTDPLLAGAVAAFAGGIAQPRFGGCYWTNMDNALNSYFGGEATAQEALQNAADIIGNAVSAGECS